LRGDVAGRDVAAACTRAAPLQQIVGQKLHMRADALRVDAPHRVRRSRRETQIRHGIGAGRRARALDEPNQLACGAAERRSLRGTGAGGSTFVVNPAGNPVVGTSDGNAVELFNLKTGAWTKLGSIGSVAGIAQDSAGDLYLGGSYSNTVAKLPYNSSTGTYATLTDFTSTAPAQCTGTDTTECAAVTTFANYVGIGSMTVDASGNLFIATDDQGTYAPHAIFDDFHGFSDSGIRPDNCDAASRRGQPIAG